MAFARNGDVQLYYEAFGNSADPPLLLVNGLGSQCINYRVECCERFAKSGFHVIRYDNRDVGLSSKFSHVSPDLAEVAKDVGGGRAAAVPYRLSEMADDGIAVLDDLSVDRAHVLGMSMGGMIVQTMAIEKPQRLLTMTSIMSTTGDPDVGQSTPEARRLFMSPPPRDRESFIAAQLARLRTWGSPGCFDEDRIAANAAEAFDRSFDPAGTARQIMAIMASGSRTAALVEVRVPTLVLHGDSDTLVDPSGGRRTADAIPGARLVMLEGMGHDFPPQYWDQVVSLVREHTSQIAV